MQAREMALVVVSFGSGMRVRSWEKIKKGLD
jgi:hypothetical protein